MPSLHIFVIPGWFGSCEKHWQSRWLRDLGGIRWIAPNWEAPCEKAWVASLGEELRRLEEPVVLIAHSLGVLAAIAALSEFNCPQVQAAFLVAPADPSPDATPAAEIGRFQAAIAGVQRLQIPALIISSQNDPYLSPSRAEILARAWGAECKNLGAVGHINVASGNGPWPEGRHILEEFLAAHNFNLIGSPATLSWPSPSPSESSSPAHHP